MSKLFYEPEAIVKKFQSLGIGGFGSVHSGILEYKVRTGYSIHLHVHCNSVLIEIVHT